VTAYRFCRTDDMGLLVSAYEGCRGPEDAGEPVLDREGFKGLVRELDLWCSSCMVALEGREPVGVLLGAKRAESTLIYGVRVHPAHRRRGHGRHLLTSLGQKLAILGPPRLVAEVPAEREPARALFDACRWRTENLLVDWRLASPAPVPGAAVADLPVAPIGIDEALESGLLVGPRCWHRDLPALGKQGEGTVGLGFHSAERLEACLLARPGTATWAILAVGGTDSAAGSLGLRVLVDEIGRQAGSAPIVLERVAGGEIDAGLLADLGFRPGAEHVLFATEAQAA
jgi:GNAT superfamily N-acetyltransferase